MTCRTSWASRRPFEFFFQLVDSFIRDGKKFAVRIGPRAKVPRHGRSLTSRFSRGMLYLVSEPGFEMKYVILKRYYENIINGSAIWTDSTSTRRCCQCYRSTRATSPTSICATWRKISGNNIRNLESFCERCAGLAAERERPGLELSARISTRRRGVPFNTARKIIHIDTVQRVVEEFYHVSHEELIGTRGPRTSRSRVMSRSISPTTYAR